VVILIALFHILRTYEEAIGSNLYSFITPPGELNETFAGLINLKKPNILLVVIAAIAQYFQGKMGLPKVEDESTMSHVSRVGRQMVYVGPVVMVVVFSSLPAAIPLYFLASTLFSIAQQSIINKELERHGSMGTIRR
jgi:YidC/Oxa1 family membrane protein insertase